VSTSKIGKVIANLRKQLCCCMKTHIAYWLNVFDLNIRHASDSPFNNFSFSINTGVPNDNFFKVSFISRIYSRNKFPCVEKFLNGVSFLITLFFNCQLGTQQISLPAKIKIASKNKHFYRGRLFYGFAQL